MNTEQVNPADIIAAVNAQLLQAGIPLTDPFADAARMHALAWIKTPEDLAALQGKAPRLR